MKVLFREAALADLAQVSRYLGERSPAGAGNVLKAIHSTIAVVADNPLAARQTSDGVIRVKIVARYNYKIFYHAGADFIESFTSGMVPVALGDLN